MKNIVDSAVHTQVDMMIDGLSVTLIPDSRWINSDHTHVHCGMHRNPINSFVGKAIKGNFRDSYKVRTLHDATPNGSNQIIRPSRHLFEKLVAPAWEKILE